jgi:tetratricopeptide (TPR) repeat protein
VTKLIKIADWDENTRINVLFVHGLGGHPYDTWRRNGDDNTFWPAWLARDVPGLAAWTLAYDAPPTNWFGMAMPIQDRAKNVLECLLGQPELKGLPLVFVGHSLGGLVVKQVLRAADGRRAYAAAEAAFLETVQGVVFIATPHTGSMHATLLDKLRLIAWPSASTLDLVKNNANLRDLNVWYRNWSNGIRHKVFYETRGTTAGVIVADDSSDPGLLQVDPVGVDSDHLAICKPADASDLVYVRTRDFIVDEIVQDRNFSTACRSFRRFDLPTLPRSRSSKLGPIAVRLAVLLILGLIAFKGVQALLFPPDLLGAVTVEEIEAAIRAKSPKLTTTQIDQFIQSLRELRGDPSFRRAVEEAQKGNTRVAEGIWLQIYENRKKEQQKAEKEQAEAARNLAASAVTNSVAQGLKWYREATSLDADNMGGWLGLGDAAMLAGTLQEADQGFLKYLELARRAGDEREVAVGATKRGDVLVAQGNLPEALKSFRAGLATMDRLAQADPGNADRLRDVSVSNERLGDVYLAQGDLSAAMEQYRASLARMVRIRDANPSDMDLLRFTSVTQERIADVLVAQGDLSAAMEQYRASLARMVRIRDANPSNMDLQRFTSATQERIGDVLVAQGNLSAAVEQYRASLARMIPIRDADPSNMDLQRFASVTHNKIGDVLVAQGDLPEALKSFRVSQDIFDRLARTDPSNAGWQRDLSTSNERLGDVYLAQGDLSAAIEQYRASLARMVPIRDADPSNMDLQHFTSVTHNKIGDVLVAQGDLPAALKSFRASHDIFDRLAQTDPSNAGWQRDLAVSHERIGDVERDLNHPAEARTAFERALAIYESLLASNPENTYFLVSSTVPLMRLGDLDPNRRKAYFERALKILKDLDAAGRLEPGRKGLIAWLESKLGL